MNTKIKYFYLKISIFYILINFDLCLSGGISSKIDLDLDEERRQESALNTGTFMAVIDASRGFTQQQMQQETNYNGGRPLHRPQDGNFVKNDKSVPNRGRENVGRVSSAKRLLEINL